MARINLLPWRQEERERKNKEFSVILAGATALTALAIGLGLALLGRDLSNYQQANEMIVAENARLDKELEEIAKLEERREEMVSRMKIIQDLQGRRSVPVRVWDDIARAIPPAMYLVGMKREGDVITITGFADNANVVSQLIRNLDASPWLANSGVPNIKSEIQAYQPSVPKQPVASDGTAARPLYPEDSYINFTVTTQVKVDEATLAEYTAQSQVDAQAAGAAPAEGMQQTVDAAVQAPTATTAEQAAAPQPQVGAAATPAPSAEVASPASTAAEQAPAGGQ